MPSPLDKSILLSAALFASSVAMSLVVATTSSSSNDKTTASSDKTENNDSEESSVHALLRERFNSCVYHIKPQLSSLSQASQLEFYALYKQATLGNAEDYLAHPPPRQDLVANAKYQAWKKFQNMSKSVAMQEYIDKAVHLEFTRSMLDYDNDDTNFELEGDAVLDIDGMGQKPSTLAAERTKEEQQVIDQQDATFPLHAAARDDQVSKLQQLLQSKKNSPDALDDAGQTALHLAADAGNPDCIKLLAKYGANVQAADHDGITVLQAAVIGGDVETCRLLCVLGANPDQPDSDGDTPRECAKDDPLLREMLFRASMGTLEIDSDLQQELRELGQETAAASSSSLSKTTGVTTSMSSKSSSSSSSKSKSKSKSNSNTTNKKKPSQQDELAVLDHIPMDGLDDGEGDI